MSRIKSRDTSPELLVRSFLHRHGLRFRLHASDLPGHPDIVLRKLKTAVFVHGCFWHRHPRCRYAYSPKSRLAFWEGKFRANVLRDRKATLALRKLGWRVLIVWECKTRQADTLCRALPELLGTAKRKKSPLT